MKKTQVQAVKFNVCPKVCVRVINNADTEAQIKNKKKKPFRLFNEVIVTVFLENEDEEDSKCRIIKENKFSFMIPKGYIWNGADIPKPLWWIGSSKDNDYLIASMVHDYLLEFKEFIYKEVLKEKISVKEYRRLSSLIFRQILKDSDISSIKANIMAFCVDIFQATINRKAWRIK